MSALVAGAFVPCAQHLPQLNSALFDCVSDDLALLLMARGVDDVVDVFGRDWRFGVRGRDDGLVTVDLPAPDRDDRMAERTGLRPRWHRVTALADHMLTWRTLLSAGDPVVLVGDAYHLPWLPYSGHEHMDHGFVLEGLSGDDDGTVAHVVDPYDNATAWGTARPLSSGISLTALEAAMAGGRWAALTADGAAVAAPDPDTTIAANAAAIDSAVRRGSYTRFTASYVAASADGLPGLSLQTWLLARDRGLHACWLAQQPAGTLARDLADQFAGEVVTAWRRAAEAAYIAGRRAASGRLIPPSAYAAVDAAAAEAAIAAQVRRHVPERTSPC